MSSLDTVRYYHHETRHAPVIPPLRAPATGVLRDAKVITTRGMRTVQDLCPGELVVTRSNGVVPIDRIEQQSLVARAIYVIAGSIGHRHKNRDTVLPADQEILIRDWRAHALCRRAEAFIRAKHLVDGEYVRDIGLQPMTVYRIHCAQPQVIYADGMELGSAFVCAAPQQTR
ncbi:MAG: Hint domain-containing protein [Pseudomonadota bacterium]